MKADQGRADGVSLTPRMPDAVYIIAVRPPDWNIAARFTAKVKVIASYNYPSFKTSQSNFRRLVTNQKLSNQPINSTLSKYLHYTVSTL